MKLFTTAAALAAFLAVSCATDGPPARFPGMVADMDPIPVGSVTAAFDRIFGGLNAAEIEVVFHPRLNSVSLEFRHELVSYRLFWDVVARQHFVNALELYNADFDARNLVDRHRQTRGVYGRVTGRLEWQTARFTAMHFSYPVVELGYRFRERSPFFALLVRSARSGDSPGGSSPQPDSRQLQIYFTRAQAADLAAMFYQPFLVGLAGIQGGTVPAAPAVMHDVFDDRPAAEPPRDEYRYGGE